MVRISSERRGAAPSIFVFERLDPTDSSLDWLEQEGIRVSRGPEMWVVEKSYSDNEIVSASQGYDAVMGASGARFTRAVMEALPALKVISKFGIGVDSIDIEAARDLGIGVCNSPDHLAVADVAEHTIGLMLGLRKNLAIWTRDYLQSGGWRPGVVAQSLAGATVGIVGLGRIGRAVVQRLRGWDAQLIAYDPYVRDAPSDLTMCDLPTLLATADIVTLHAAPSKDNRHLIGAEAFAAMQPSSILINCSRASLVDTNALIIALETKQIMGAAIDVFDEEPPPAHSPLLRLSNLIATPHVANWTARSLQNVGWQGARGAHAMLGGQPWHSIICPATRLSLDGVARSDSVGGLDV